MNVVLSNEQNYIPAVWSVVIRSALELVPRPRKKGETLGTGSSALLLFGLPLIILFSSNSLITFGSRTGKQYQALDKGKGLFLQAASVKASIAACWFTSCV